MATGQENRDNQPSAAVQGPGGQGADWEALKGDVGEMAGAAMDQGRQILDSAREQATGFVDQRKNDLAQSVVNLANSLRESGSAFEDRQQIKTLVDSAAGGLESLAENIRGRDLADILDNVEGLVRRRPGVAAVATMAAGFLVARFVKASVNNASAKSSSAQPRQFGSNTGQQTSGNTGQQTSSQHVPGRGTAESSPPLRGQIGA
jgi:uncharacterized protein YjbJ (UPF0337 family)